MDKERIKNAIAEIDKKIQKAILDSDAYTTRLLRAERENLVKLLNM